jgi:hypothetical protein
MSYIGRGIDQIDNISTLDNLTFNGSDATFNLTQNSVAFVPVSADALQIQIDGIIQSGNYTCSGSQITFDFVPSGSSVCNGIRHFGVGLLTTVSDGAVTTAKLGNNSVGITQLNVSDGTNGQALTTNGSGTLAFSTISGTTINNNADNRVITGSGTANTLEGESALTFNGTILQNNQAQNTDATFHASSYTTGVKLIADSQNSISKIDSSGTLAFINNSTETMRIHSGSVDADKVSIGTTNALGALHIMYNAGDSTSQGVITITANNTGNSTGILFLDGQNQVCGRITVKGGNNTSQFYTSSDHRLKQDVAPMDSSLETIKSLQPKKYKWNTNPDSGYHQGFLAHELQSVIPDAVDGEHNAVDDENNPIYQGVDKTAIIPHLTKALQEAITKIETLEAKVQALENA